MKESRHVYISVDGDVCETLYFEHLRTLINSNPQGKYNLKLSIKKANPYSYVKQNAYKPMDKDIQDVEDYNDEGLRKQFKALVDEMKKAEKDFRIPTFLGYSNYTFELWMLLHATDMKSPVANRYAYLKHINKYFCRKYQGLEEYKEGEEFHDILCKYVNLGSVYAAIDRADYIDKQKKQSNQRCEQYRNLVIYPDNPYTTVHQVVSSMLSLCGIQKP